MLVESPRSELWNMLKTLVDIRTSLSSRKDYYAHRLDTTDDDAFLAAGKCLVDFVQTAIACLLDLPFSGVNMNRITPIFKAAAARGITEPPNTYRQGVASLKSDADRYTLV